MASRAQPRRLLPSKPRSENVGPSPAQIDWLQAARRQIIQKEVESIAQADNNRKVRASMFICWLQCTQCHTPHILTQCKVFSFPGWTAAAGGCHGMPATDGPHVWILPNSHRETSLWRNRDCQTQVLPQPSCSAMPNCITRPHTLSCRLGSVHKSFASSDAGMLKVHAIHMVVIYDHQLLVQPRSSVHYVT
jgi:hypothetical protein